MVENEVVKKAKDAEKIIYPQLIKRWRSICEQNKYDKVLGDSIDIMQAFASGKSIDAAERLLKSQKHSDGSRLRVLNIVAEFTKGAECKGIDLFIKVEHDYTLKPVIVKKFDNYKQQILKCESLCKRFDKLRAYERNVARSKRGAYETHLREAYGDELALEELEKAVELIETSKKSKDLSSIKLGESLNDVWVARLIIDIDGEKRLDTIVDKNGVLPNVRDKAIKEYEKAAPKLPSRPKLGYSIKSLFDVPNKGRNK